MRVTQSVAIVKLRPRIQCSRKNEIKRISYFKRWSVMFYDGAKQLSKPWRPSLWICLVVESAKFIGESGSEGWRCVDGGSTRGVVILADDPCFAREFWYEYLVKANYVSQIAFTPPRSERDAVGWAAHGLLWLLSSNIWIKVRTKHNISNIGSRKP